MSQTSSDEPKKEDLILEGKNKDVIICQKCPSKILNQGAGEFKEIEFDLPGMQHRADGGVDNSEALRDFWQVNDIYTFENIGFSKTVGDGLKYLICADCEMGPIGWHHLASKQSYIALSRVRYK